MTYLIHHFFTFPVELPKPSEVINYKHGTFLNGVLAE